MTSGQLAVALFFVVGAASIIWASWSWYQHNLEREQWKRRIAKVAEADDELRQVISLGLYERFRPARPGEAKEEQPLDFERFVARVMGWHLGGEGVATRGSGDLGVDVIVSVDDTRSLGQVKCETSPVGYEPVAIIHSQVNRQQAREGFVVSFNGFTSSAQEYGRAVNVRLITGPELVDIWLDALQARAAAAESLLVNEEPEPVVTG